MRRTASACLGVFALLLAACGPAAEATPTTARLLPTPTKTIAPSQTAAPSGTALASTTSTPTPKASASPGSTSEVKPRYGGILRGSSYQDPQTWDPYAGGLSSFNVRHLNLIYLRLFTYQYGPPVCRLFPPDGDLAKSWSWVDDVTLDVKLHEGVRFQKAAPVNGREVTADDVARSLGDMFSRLVNLKPLADITASVSALDKYTVRFKLKQPFPEYIEAALTKQPAMILAPEVNTPGKVWEWQTSVGTGNGPFVLKDYRPGVKIDLEKNPEYFQRELPYLDGVRIFTIPDEATTGAMIRTGQVDAVQLRDMGVQNYIATKAPEINLQMCAYPASHEVNMRTDKPPFNDVRVRRALSMAIDRDLFNKTVWLGMGIPRWSPVHQFQSDWVLPLADYPADIRQYAEYHPDRAKALLSEAGYSGQVLQLTYSTGAAGARAVAEALSAFWQQVGVQTRLVPEGNSSFSIRMIRDQGDYEHIAIHWASSATIDDTIYQYFYSANPRNNSHVNDPKLDEMLLRFRKTLDQAQARKLMNDIQVYLMDKQYRLDLPEMTRPLALQPNVRDVWYKTDGYSETEFLRFAWLAR